MGELENRRVACGKISSGAVGIEVVCAVVCLGDRAVENVIPRQLQLRSDPPRELPLGVRPVAPVHRDDAAVSFP